MFDIILFEPEIPPNTGNIIRLCANTGARLHLIEPIRFQLEDRLLRRAGLDYHQWATVKLHRNLAAFLAEVRPPRLFALTTKGARSYHAVAYQPDDALLFGPETRGLPAQVLADLASEQRLHIPMRTEARSLNLSNAVAIVVYEAWRQCGFLDRHHGTSHE
ncbi:MAG: tRNA (uridine(34)/cytosine(34)/5-carboxymethylaminomethyluridine(34)-2'-O)-methyltransferase TrmL [Candidatus Competibacteraceae bacterium]|uniref:tRNA (cytidine(34)-2'-O)-methyltransferase n=1 Tax=Candidatus Contendobacter odensis Run_B_J11 TaxID=1400861 RepID=A0A7U7GFS7_9GAMM|nr:tRNA (uridine(34)/cytosine(34)/5-carboxymethylaminomethyluridine(34)-2'-O)-methyltransferase TrmL [Candidatus Contendobacter odensis]MBK8537328.1 tRNA (uridine(34)/cytosine(34)/5-carboxymethylaminomethyluridine(34)-2'-O)-methyltransferase TrmL [Candidatus Competibacteraceae bacterium]MBK8753667.1 tRNA (uridine(34)/cytosine(34)/5-carboxymethylaminomethyluridine(34)-2'-O)-methyltransferase TrmL [Candidatus Competibacteraceae bacterium]CDH47071.1 putative rRNA methylase [Candidatus Contendobacte